MKLRTLRVDRAASEWNMLRKIPARAEDPVGRILFHYVYEKMIHRIILSFRRHYGKGS